MITDAVTARPGTIATVSDGLVQPAAALAGVTNVTAYLLLEFQILLPTY